MATYMALLWESPTAGEGLSPEEIQQIIEKYRAWSIALEEKGAYRSGDKLVDGWCRTLESEGGQVRVLDGPFGESKEVVGGYFLLEADSEQAAVDLLRDCPHLAFGGRIELRAVEPT